MHIFDAKRLLWPLLAALIVVAFCSAQQNLLTTTSGVISTTGQTTLGSPTLNSSICQVVLANNTSYGVLQNAFQNLVTSAKSVVYFHFQTLDVNGNLQPFSVANSDTFAPDEWVWATSKGKNLLRMPLDYTILSLGLLAIGSSSMDIVLDHLTEFCLRSSGAPYSYTAHILAQFLDKNVTTNGTAVALDTNVPVICRSAFAFSHRMFGPEGIGFKCCSAPVTATDTYHCDTPYSSSWEMVWYGPVLLLCWVYAIFMIHFYKLYRHSFVKQKIRELSGLKQTMDEIKQDIVNRIFKNAENLANVRSPDELIALRDSSGFLDILGVGKARQAKIIVVLRVLFVLFLFSIYYIACGVFLLVYNQQLGGTLQRLNETGIVYLNVLGHLGWIFCDQNNAIFGYAVFELIYTLLLPFFALLVYVSLKYRADAAEFSEKMKKEESASGLQQQKGFHVQVTKPAPVTGCKRLFLRFIVSDCGRIIQAVCFFLFFLYAIMIAGVFLTYVIYFVGLGIFANIDAVSPYFIPLVACIHFFANSFSPAYYQYQTTKDTFFSICLDKNDPLLIKREKEIFLPRDLIESFYIPNSRSTIYNCVQRILIVIAFMILLVLVVLTLQYPYYYQPTSIVSFLGVQVVFILPFLARFVNNTNTLSSIEQTLLKRDLEVFIQSYEKNREQHAPVVAAALNGAQCDAGRDADNDAIELSLSTDDDVYHTGQDVIKLNKM